MSDPMPTVRSILGMPEPTARITPIRQVTPEFSDSFATPYTDDDIQARGDDLRDKAKYDDLDGWRPADEDLA